MTLFFYFTVNILVTTTIFHAIYIQNKDKLIKLTWRDLADVWWLLALFALVLLCFGTIILVIALSQRMADEEDWRL